MKKRPRPLWEEWNPCTQSMYDLWKYERLLQEMYQNCNHQDLILELQTILNTEAAIYLSLLISVQTPPTDDSGPQPYHIPYSVIQNLTDLSKKKQIKIRDKLERKGFIHSFIQPDYQLPSIRMYTIHYHAIRSAILKARAEGLYDEE